MTSIKTQPLARYPKGVTPDPNKLAAGRYGTEDMAKIWGPDKTIELSLLVQGVSAQVLSGLHPDIVPPSDADEIHRVATSGTVLPERVREIEAQTGHDVIAINTALEEQLSASARTHVNKGKTSADTTQPVRALQLQYSLKVLILITENFRDILCEKAQEWKDVPFMDTTHLYDALPTVAGRPLVHYIEMLQSNIQFLKYVYDNSIKGKWGDATGNHHSADALEIDGVALQQKLSERLGVGYMDAAGQVPGLEFEMDVAFAMSRLSETFNNIAKFIANGRSDDVNIFVNGRPQKQKGSSAMPHKDAKNGNPTAEEQMMSIRNLLAGNLQTATMNAEMPYARNLAASANARVNFEDGFKILDHGIRNLASLVYWLQLKKDRSIERVTRSFGVVTSQQVMTYLTDARKTNNPMSRSDAHNLTARLATEAFDTQTPFVDIVLACPEITSRLGEDVIRDITDPLKYIGQSKQIVDQVTAKYHKNKILG